MQRTVVRGVTRTQQASPGCSAPTKFFCNYFKNWSVLYLNTYQAEYGKLYLTSNLLEDTSTDICLWS